MAKTNLHNRANIMFETAYCNMTKILIKCVNKQGVQTVQATHAYNTCMQSVHNTCSYYFSFSPKTVLLSIVCSPFHRVRPCAYKEL